MLIKNCQAILRLVYARESETIEVVCDMLPVTVSLGVFKTLNGRQSELNKKCEAIKQIFTSQTLKVLLVYARLREFLGRCSPPTSK